MTQPMWVIFVSRRNSLRSVLAQACLAHLDAGRFTAYSCGQPGFISDAIHPAAIGALSSASIRVPQVQPRGWDELARASAQRANFIITLDEATQSVEPPWPGQPDSALWAFPDAAAFGEPEEAAHAAIQMLYALRRRLELLISLPLRGADPAAIRSDVRELAHTQ